MQRKQAAQASKKVDEFDPTLVWYLRPFFQFLYYHYFRVNAVGISNVPKKGPAIIVANHAGCLPYDAVMINLATYNRHPEKRPVKFLVHDFAFNIPFLDVLVKRTGGIQASPRNAQNLLENNELILVFPEGVRGIGKEYNQRYKLQKFGRGGFIRTAIKTKSPIIPTAIIGSEEIHPIIWAPRHIGEKLGVPFFPVTPTFPWLGPLGLMPLPSKWKIVFGKPIRFDDTKTSDAEKPALVKRKTGEVKKIIQKMINKELARRKSIWM